MAKVIFTPGLRTQIGGAAPKTFIEVANSKEIEKRFRKLATDVKGRLLVAAMMDGAEVIRQRTAELAPKPSVRRHPGTKRLSDSIIKAVLFRGSDSIRVGVFPDYRTENTKIKSGGKVAHLVERGHKWWYGGFQEGKPFMGPAYDATKQRAMQVIQNRLQKEVSRTTKSLNKEG